MAMASSGSRRRITRAGGTEATNRRTAMATMKDVARLSGVSIATVSAALSGRNFVSSTLKERVQAAVEELGYSPNAMASGLKRGRSSLIGLVVPDITNPFFTELVHGVQRRAAEQGYNVILGVSDDNAAREAELIRLMRSHQAVGTIVIPCGSEDDCRKLGNDGGSMPLVAVDNAPLGLKIDTVVIDNRRAADLAVAHILAQGHTEIATISGPSHRFVSRERLLGFEAALESAGIPLHDGHAPRGDFHVEAGRGAGLELFSRPHRPTAVFVANNQMLIGVMQAVSEAGLRVPEDISIVAIDDFPWAAAFMPALTTVRQPIARLAQEALNRLMARVDGDTGEPRRIVLEPELVVRASCGAPAAAA
jgi:LacI family transcriptional regulator